MAKVIHLSQRRKLSAPSPLLTRLGYGQKMYFRVVTPLQINLSRRLGPNALRTVLYLRGLQGRPTTLDWMATDLQIDPAAIFSSVALLLREGFICTGAPGGL
jgi:hypothetical protein